MAEIPDEIHKPDGHGRWIVIPIRHAAAIPAFKGPIETTHFDGEQRYSRDPEREGWWVKDGPSTWNKVVEQLMWDGWKEVSREPCDEPEGWDNG